jgi:hypothetical protein
MKTVRRTRIPKIVYAFLTLALIATASPQLTGGTALAVDFTRNFRIEDCTWSSRGDQNPFFSLHPGSRLVLEGEEEDDGKIVNVEAVITVLHQKKRITFESARGETIRLKARVVEERESEEGELVEVSRNWFARCVETSDIYYFGEDVDDYEDGGIVSHEGAWIAGENGALPGILMPGTFLLGAKYYQEIAPGVAMDRGRNVDMGLEVSTPAGTFSDCVAVIDSSFLDPEAEDLKIYCPGVGIVVDEDLTLTEYGQVQQ